MEKPYLIGEYPKMHLSLPDIPYKPMKLTTGPFDIAGAGPTGGFAIMEYGKAKCSWDIFRGGACLDEDAIISLSASYFWREEFNFEVVVASDTIGIGGIGALPPEEAFAWDEQSYIIPIPTNASGSTVICGFASTHTLTSQTFETKVAGMPVTLMLRGGKVVYISERGQVEQAGLIRSNYGRVGTNCGCITISSNCGKNPEWDRDNSATTVVPGDTCVVTVEDGCAPYNWSVSGTGFSFDNPQTSTGTNTLTAGDDACGTAIITVSSDCGDTTGYVRSTVGQWANQTNGCIIPGAWTSKSASGASKYWFYRVEDQYRQSQEVWAWYGIGSPGPPPEWSCADVDCSAKGDPNCVDCLEWSCTDFNPGWDNCGGWCCGTGFGCGGTAGGYCMKNTYLYYHEWVC